MDLQFNGAALRLARLFNELSLEDVATMVGKSRQYLHKMENAPSDPSFDVVTSLAAGLKVRPGFFYQTTTPVAEEAIHFRKMFTARAMVKHFAIAKAEAFRRLVNLLDNELQLPAVRLPARGVNSMADVELVAEECRREWGLGMGPVDNMIRLAENVGAVVTTFSSISREVDALSIGGARPIIVRNDAKASSCRQRYDIAHELGHAVMHQGIRTGDRLTESEANRFAGALLVPQSMMVKFFPRPRGSRLDKRGISDFKMQWKISKAALLYRAWQLELLTDGQFRSGMVDLKTRGEAMREKEDDSIEMERPELVATSFDVLRNRRGITMANVAEALHVQMEWLTRLTGPLVFPEAAANVIQLRRLQA